MTTSDTHSSKGAAVSGTASIDGISCGALALLLQAFAYAHDAGGERWDFALEIDRLYEAGLTISDLRWLVAKEFAEHGQECSVYGSPHRSYRRRAGFCFDHTTCVVLTPRGAAFVAQVLKAPVVSLQSVPPIETAFLAEGETAAVEDGLPAPRWTQGYNPWHIKTVLELNAASADSAWHGRQALPGAGAQSGTDPLCVRGGRLARFTSTIRCRSVTTSTPAPGCTTPSIGSTVARSIGCFASTATAPEPVSPGSFARPGPVSP